MRAPDANVAPEFTSATTSRTVVENTAAGEDIGNPVAANDANGDALTYALSGTDAASFDIDPDTGQLMTKVALDFEAKASYTVTVTASDGTDEATIDVTINVTDVGELGMVSGDATASYVENGDGPVATYTATGPSAASARWRLSGDDARDFTITGGVLAFISAPDHENPADADTNNVYMVTVQANAGGEMDTQDVTVTVTDVNELGMVSGAATVDYAENGTGPVATYTASGPDAASARWSLSGDDAGDFTISNGGELTFAASPDYEAAADADTDNDYQVTVQANAGGEMDEVAVTVTVTNVDELTISGMATVDYAENGTGPVATYTASGPDSDIATWSLEGDDAGVFDINDGGMLTFKASPDFETPTDADTDNDYQVTVQATAGGVMDMVDVTVTVANVDELTISGMAAVDYAENGTGPVATYTAAGPDSDMATWSLEGDDMGDFSISSGGVLTFNSPPDYENPMDMDGDNVYMVTVVANDGTYKDTHDVMVTVTTLLGRFDANNNGSIDQAEIGTAVLAYQFDRTINQAEIEELIILYQFGGG